MKPIGKKLWSDLTERYRVGFLVWIISLVVFCAVTLLSWWNRHDLYDQQAAARWSEEDDYAQLSCFYPITQNPTDYDFQSLYHAIEDALDNASIEKENELAKLFVDAYSVIGKLTLSTDNGTMEVNAAGVTENFFLFHPVALLEGSYFDEEMLMDDGIILDEDAAFQLYGSNDVVGMPVYIGSKSFYIRGVVERATGYLEEASGLESSLCYVPVQTVLELGQIEGSYTYEVLMPNPVDGFAKNILITALNDTENTLEIIENSSRFSPSARKEILYDYALRSMSSRGMIYPYWENIARAKEDICAALYLIQMITFVIIAVLSLWYVWYRYKKREWNLKMLWERMPWVSVFFLMVVLSGCGQKQADAEASAQSKEYVYAFTSFNDKFEEMELSQAFYGKDRLLLTSYRTEEIMPDAGEMMMEPGIDGMMEQMPEEEIWLEEPVEEEVIEEIVEEEVIVVEEAVAMEAAAVDYVEEEFYYDDMYMEEYTQNTYFKVTQTTLDGEWISEFEILMPPDSGICGVSGDGDGNIYMLLNEYGKDMSDPEMIKDLFSLIAYTESGEEIWRVTLGETAEEGDWYYANQVFVMSNDRIALASTSGIEVFKSDGSFDKVIESEDAVNGNVYLLRDERIGFLIYGNRGMYMKTLDLETEELSERIEFPFNAYEYSFYPGLFTDLLLVSSSGVYSYDFEDEGLQKMLDFVDSDMMSNDLYSLVEVQKNRLFGCFYDEETGNTQFGLFNKVDPSTIKDKKVLTLACYWLDSDVRRRVVEYNKTSEEYRIRVVDYNQYNTSDDYSIGMTKMNTDIASGNTPDIIMVSSDMPVDSYISKGLFADLNPFLEADPELNREDYTENIFEVFSQDGKWYQMVPSYYLYTIIGKASEVGETPGWTMEELNTLREEKGKDVAVFSEMTQSGVLNYILLFAGNQFIDWETGECHFETQEFIDLLEFANEFPKEIDYSELYEDQDYWEQQETMFRDGRALLMPYSIANIEDFKYVEKGMFGEPVTAVGFPVKQGVGSVIMYNSNFAIGAKSPYQQEAWEFIRYYLTKEYQDTINYGWPVLKSSLDTKMKEAQGRPFYIDENGEKVEYDDTYYIGGVEVVLDPLTQEDCDRVTGFLESAEDIYSYDTAIMNIVYEETAPYFDGEKTAEEVADIIQSRIYIYVNENR